MANQSRATSIPPTPRPRPGHLPQVERYLPRLVDPAEPKHRTKNPTKSALKHPSGRGRDRRPSDATEVDSGYGSSIETRKHNKSSAFTVWEEQLKPPGPSGTPKESTNPLPEQGPNNSRRSRHSVSNPPPPVAQPPSQPVGRSYHEKSSYDDPVARTTSRREGSRSRTMNERFPENTSLNAEQDGYEPIPPNVARTTYGPGYPTHQNYAYPDFGASQEPRFAPQTPYRQTQAPPQQFPHHYQAPQQYQAYPRYYGGGQSESENRPPLVPRPARYRVNAGGGYSDTEGYSQHYPAQPLYGSGVAPQALHDHLVQHQRRQRQEEERQQQDLERQQREQQQRLEQEQLERERHEREQRRHERRERERQERERQELHEREQRRHERQELERQELERRERGRQQQRLVHEHHPWGEPVPAETVGDQLRRMGNRTASQRHPPDADRARSSAAAPPAAERFVGVKTSQGWTVPPLLHSAPPSWPLIEFRQREHLPAPMMFFDISQDPNDPTEGRGIRLLARERSFGISTPFLEEHKNLPFAKTVKMKMIDMVCTAPELKEWNVVIKSEDVIRVIDVFEAIYKTYQVPLTPAELDKYRHLVNSSACQRAFKRRCEKSHGLTYVNRMRGVCRVDLVGDRTLFLKVHMGETSRRYEFDLIMQDHSADICQSVIPRNPNPVGHYMP